MRIQTSVRVEEKFYLESRRIFDSMGITFGDAVNMFLAKTSQEQGIPFQIEIPSKELSLRVDNVKTNTNIEKLDSIDELFINLDK